jgi:hypothetical protein
MKDASSMEPAVGSFAVVESEPAAGRDNRLGSTGAFPIRLQFVTVRNRPLLDKTQGRPSILPAMTRPFMPLSTRETCVGRERRVRSRAGIGPDQIGNPPSDLELAGAYWAINHSHRMSRGRRGR